MMVKETPVGEEVTNAERDFYSEECTVRVVKKR